MKEREIKRLTIITAVQIDPYETQTFYFRQNDITTESVFFTVVYDEWKRQGKSLDAVYIHRDIPDSVVLFRGVLDK